MEIADVTDITVVTDLIENDIGRIMVGCVVLCLVLVLCVCVHVVLCVLCLRVRVVWWCVWCGGACGVVVRVVWWCVCVVCGEAWHVGKSSVCRFKTPPCVRSGCLRVYRQQARMEYFRRGNYFVLQFYINSEKSTPCEITVITVLY